MSEGEWMNPGPELPQTMRAGLLTGYGGPEMLKVGDVPLPAHAPHNEVLIEVRAAGLNPFEAKLRRGWLAGLFPLPLPHVLGTDVAGIVVRKGFDVSELEVGDAVYGLLDPMKQGTYAGYVAAPSYLVRRKPANLDFAEAAAVPMAACTAWHGLVNMAGIGPGSRVLVQAASGGVGAFAVQIAKAHGAWVAATCSAANSDFVRSLGADQVIDYAAGSLAEAVGDLDLVLNCIGGETALESYKVLKRGGQLLIVLRGDMVELKARHQMMAQHGVTTREIAFSAQPEILDRLRPLIEEGRIKVHLERRIPLEDVAEAHALLDAGRRRGKLVLEMGARG
ncbi:NADP-dependent oxidoreductase [Erythrobacter sp. WG]|uniref:NADP-dependent oxidoreductase n=1 Tax=Erythrobacter sp. WG TaxID=2985510 RepID=UPI00226E3ED9|nr:NADP-dependent oxidoreductase [Erythrobacter sp. WG]MCX9148497.1 NADP-dependent oxidoreductase [Erythrobacter sp. WG]